MIGGGRISSERSPGRCPVSIILLFTILHHKFILTIYTNDSKIYIVHFFTFDLQMKYKLDNDNNLLNSLISLCIIAL